MWSATGYVSKVAFADGIDMLYERNVGREYDPRTEIQKTEGIVWGGGWS